MAPLHQVVFIRRNAYRLPTYILSGRLRLISPAEFISEKCWAYQPSLLVPIGLTLLHKRIDAFRRLGQHEITRHGFAGAYVSCAQT
jgi:hypothetical protein